MDLHNWKATYKMSNPCFIVFGLGIDSNGIFKLPLIQQVLAYIISCIRSSSEIPLLSLVLLCLGHPGLMPGSALAWQICMEMCGTRAHQAPSLVREWQTRPLIGKCGAWLQNMRQRGEIRVISSSLDTISQWDDFMTRKLTNKKPVLRSRDQFWPIRGL